MTANYDLYSIASPTLDQARVIVERGLGISLSRHESSWCGDYFRAGMSGGEHFILKANQDLVEDEWAEPQYKTARFLLYVNETLRAAALREALGRLPQVTHLRSGRA